MVFACGSVSCSGELPDANETLSSPILGGVEDTQHTAVQALIFSPGGTCTGTTIAVKGQSGILLTAAHCVIEFGANDQPLVPIRARDPSAAAIVPGPDFSIGLSTGQYFSAIDIHVHPEFAADTGLNDIALVRYAGATEQASVIVNLSAGEDKLMAKAPVTVVGYGVTGKLPNSKRYQVDQAISDLSARTFRIDQTDKRGSCNGDSGGPVLVEVGGAERVAGIVSHGEGEGCATISTFTRVSAYEDFIQAFVTNVPAELNCAECRHASIGAGNPCNQAAVQCAEGGTSCREYATCSAACSDASCIATCASAQPQGAKDYGTLNSCACSTCQRECEADAICKTFDAESAGTAGASADVGAAAGGGSATGEIQAKPELAETGCVCSLVAPRNDGAVAKWSFLIVAAAGAGLVRRRGRV
jgi:secreted trypsin-like serine protease